MTTDPPGVPASPSGSRACGTEPQSVSALRAAIPNAGDASYMFEVWQDDCCVAAGEASSLEAMQREAGHYAVQYAQDGPVTVHEYVRFELARGMEARSGETEGLDPAGATARSATPTRPEGMAAQGEAPPPSVSDFQLEQLFDAVHEHGEFGRGFREHARRILAAAPPPEQAQPAVPALTAALEDLRSVLCDPGDRCCIHGSDEDRAVVDRSLATLAALAAPPAQVEQPMPEQYKVVGTVNIAQGRNAGSYNLLAARKDSHD